MISANRCATDVLEHTVGDKDGQVRLASRQVHVEPAVIVKIGVVAPHGGEDHVQTCLLGDVLETVALQIPEQPVRIPEVRLTEEASDHVRERAVVAGGEDVQPAVVVVVPRPAREAPFGPIDAHG